MIIHTSLFGLFSNTVQYFQTNHFLVSRSAFKTYLILKSNLPWCVTPVKINTVVHHKTTTGNAVLQDPILTVRHNLARKETVKVCVWGGGGLYIIQQLYRKRREREKALRSVSFAVGLK